MVGVYNVATHTAEPPVKLEPGDEAPDFTLPGSDGRTYRLSDLRGRPVVIADGSTGGCPASGNGHVTSNP